MEEDGCRSSQPVDQVAEGEEEAAVKLVAMRAKIEPMFGDQSDSVAHFLCNVESLQQMCSAGVRSKAHYSKLLRQTLVDVRSGCNNVMNSLTKGGEQQTQNNQENSSGNTPKQNEAASDTASLGSGTTKEGSATAPSNISKSELVALKAQVDSFHNIAVEAATQVTAAQQKLQEQKAAADAAMKAAEETAGKLAASQEEVEKLRLEVESYKEAARCAEHKLEASERDLKQMQQQVDSCTAASLKAAESQKRQQELEQQVSSFTEAAVTASGKVKDLQQQLQELKNDKEGLQKRFDEAQAKIASSEDQLSLSTSLMKEAKDTMMILNNELEAANAMKNDVQARLQACQSELKVVGGELESSKAARANAEQQLAGLANQALTLSASVNKKAEEVQLKTQLIESLRHDLAATHQELVAKSEQLGQLESENRSLKDAYDVMSSERSRVFEHMKSLARETQDAYNRNAAEKGDLYGKLQQQAVGTQQRIEQLTAERNEWFLRMQAAQESTTKLAAERDAAREKLQGLKKQHEQTVKGLNEMWFKTNRELQSALKKATKYENLLRAEQAQVKRLTDQRSSVQQITDEQPQGQQSGVSPAIESAPKNSLVEDKEQQITQLSSKLCSCESQLASVHEAHQQSCAVVQSLISNLQQLFDDHLAAHANIALLSTKLKAANEAAEKASSQWLRRLSRLRRLADRQALGLCVLRFQAQRVLQKMVSQKVRKTGKRKAKRGTPSCKPPAKKRKIARTSPPYDAHTPVPSSPAPAPQLNDQPTTKVLNSNAAITTTTAATTAQNTHSAPVPNQTAVLPSGCIYIPVPMATPGGPMATGRPHAGPPFGPPPSSDVLVTTAGQSAPPGNAPNRQKHGIENTLVSTGMDVHPVSDLESAGFAPRSVDDVMEEQPCADEDADGGRQGDSGEKLGVGIRVVGDEVVVGIGDTVVVGSGVGKDGNPLCTDDEIDAGTKGDGCDL